MEATATKVNFQKYPSYKDSGQDWLGVIPEHWSLTRLGSYFEERKTKVSDKDFAPLSVTKQGILPQLDSAAKTNDGDNRKLVKKGDFVINSRSDRKGSSGIANEDGSVSLINIVMKPKSINPSFCNYLLKSNAFVEENYRIGHGIVADLWTTRYDEMKNIKIGIPSPLEQTAIAAFLDDKTAKIDRAITQKEKMIALLKERKQIIIQNAVTGKWSMVNGQWLMTPKEKMKDSGVEWLGEIPEQWQAIKMKYLFRDVSEKNKPEAELLSVTQDQGVVPRTWVENRMVMPSGNLESFKFIQKGDFAISLRSFEGGLEYCHHDGIISPAYTVLKKKKGLIDGYYKYLFKSKSFISEIQTSVVGIREGKNISYFELSYSLLPIPSPEEQTAIVTHIETQSTKIDKAIKLQEQQIVKLKELKSTLIDSAVTGKIKVS